MSRISISAVIFDLDGVLVDSEKVHEKAKRKTLAHFGLDVPEGLFDMFMGRTDRHLFAYLQDVYGLSDELAAEMYDVKQETYRSLRDELELIPGSVDLLSSLSGKTRLALVTSASRSNQRISFDKFELDRFFAFVLAQEDVDRPKPDPAPFLEASRRLELEPEQIIVIEDSPNGVQSGADAGCHVIGLTTNFQPGALTERGARWIASDFDEIELLLASEIELTPRSPRPTLPGPRSAR